MHRDDFDLLAGVLTAAHREAVDSGSLSAVTQCEGIALAVASALAGQERTFDPVKFVLAASGAAEPRELTPAAQLQLEARFGREPRRRVTTERPGLLPDEQIDCGHWAEDLLVGAVMFDVSKSHAASMAISALVDGGVGTLGQLMSRSDAQLRAINRIGPAAMAVIRKVKELWEAELDEHPEAARRRVFPRSSEHIPASRAGIGFPAANPLTGRSPERAADRRAAGRPAGTALHSQAAPRTTGNSGGGRGASGRLTRD